MSERFDPTRFIAAERLSRERVAPPSDTACDNVEKTETAESRRFSAAPEASEASVADVAPVAARPGAGFPWENGFARLFAMPVPEKLGASRWAQLLSDAETFSHDWGAIAIKLGWAVEDIFGCPSNPYSAAVDQLGLVPLLRGRPVIAMTDKTAAIGNVRGVPNTYYLYPWRRPGVPLWVAYGQIGGP